MASPFEESRAVGMRSTHQESGLRMALESATAQEEEEPFDSDHHADSAGTLLEEPAVLLGTSCRDFMNNNADSNP